MRPSFIVVATFVASSLATRALYAQEMDAARRARVDAVFSRFATDHTPGCAVAIKENGRITYEQGYGLASIELGVPITPRTVFDIGSVSKQFTAASVILLAIDGKLSLDDDIRKHLPRLPDVGAKVTIRHLLNHTSGWRDYTDLMSLAGFDERDHTTDQDAWDVLRRQHALNFKPGATWRYSNTGFFLLGEIVKAVSGKPLREFAHERIFEPLGMRDTRYLDDTRLIVPRRAASYAPEGDGWVISASDWEQVGDGAIQTTVEDLAKWDENFDHPTVGGDALVRQLQERGVLANGTRLTYASGIVVDEYHGLPRVQHGGAWAGFRAQFTRFPSRGLAVLITCNAANSNPGRLANGVADALLDLPADAQTATAGASASATDVARHAGLWRSDATGGLLQIEAHDGELHLGSGAGARPLVALGSDRFRDPVTGVEWRFTADAQHLVSVERGLPDTLVRTRPTAATLRLDDYVGTYAGEDVAAQFDVKKVGDHLVLHRARGADLVLRPRFEDAFDSYEMPMMRFVRAPGRAIVGFTVTTRGVHDLRFDRVSKGAH